ncbi:hypothetical protein ABB37_08106 [Leptomonas pyrrhocoris]|uniref:Uncharacterized protein n=1 Tax=Leptomonas pyrrhocoris TaxID=157538 RepID=A0A0M9FTW8_LEPPY|nr:hypothetical protein ABB37_08106 [Leptomonas pyrrhocoris]KPA75943.1 hypothetical protein ABB37_08106 [Leptomonas pyrrhocoris]|eukprot:XP_015654382.1 hypothetical protein ABB37_08106 [Leptomonas pyrrhocoris]
MAADALTRGQKTPRGDCWAGLASNGDDHHHRNADATAEAQQSLTPQALHARAAAASTSGATNAEGTTHNITLRICTLSGFTLRVVVDRRLPVSQLADRVAQYIHVHRAHVQLKYTKTGAVFDAVSAVAPEEAAKAVNTTRSPSSATTTSLRLCDLPNLADADVFLVLLRPQATTSADPSLLSSSFLPPSRGFDQRSPAASRQVAKRQRTSGGGSGHSTATRKSGAAPAASAPSSLSASSPPHRTSFPSPLSPRRPSASAARRSSIADNNDGSVEVDRSGGGAGGLTATVQSGGREFMRGSYGFPPLMGASTASSARASSPPPPPPPPLR